MQTRHVVQAVSLLFHLGLLFALNQLEPVRAAVEEVIPVTTVERPKHEEEKPKPPDPEPAPAPRPAPRAAPKAAPPAEAAPPPAPDFGFVMSGGGGGPGGVAVPTAAPAPVARQAVKKLVAAAPAADTCGEPEVKAKATGMPHPAYTDEARAAGVEGKVRVQLALSAEGAVTAATVIEGLGYGLDEAAVAALRGATFAPATRCGKPVATTFTVSVRFAL